MHGTRAAAVRPTWIMALGLSGAAVAAGLNDPDSLKAASTGTAAEGALLEPPAGKRLVWLASSFRRAAEYSPAASRVAQLLACSACTCL